MGLPLERKDREIKPYALWRHSCPFYGFSSILEKIMRDTGENQCALIPGPYSVCHMEKMRDKPNWYSCHLNNNEKNRKIEKCLEKTRVFPREFLPSKGKSWDGMLLRIWIRHMIDMGLGE